MTTSIGKFTGDPEQPNGCTFTRKRRYNASTTDLNYGVVVDSSNLCYAFAWVNFTAGAATCQDCLVYSQGTVQNTTSVSVKQDFITEYALRLLMHTSRSMGGEEFDDISPLWNNINDYVAGTLTRSYAASWMYLTENLAKSGLHNTTYSVSAPSSQALVELPRVYVWLALQFLVTLSGALFIYIQSWTDTAIIVNTTLAAFYLDTRTIYERGEVHETAVMRRVEFEGDCLWLRAEHV